MKISRFLLAPAALSLLAGCAVGPDFERPAAPEVKGYAPEPLPAETKSTDIPGGAAQHFAEGRDIAAQWWEVFHSEPLNRLIEQALKANPDLKAAEAALRAAEHNLSAAEGAFFPTVTPSFTPQRLKNAVQPSPTLSSYTPYFNFFSAQVSVSYVLDVWGGTRRAVETAAAQAEAQRFQTEAAYLTLTANLVGAAVQEASLRGQIAATQRLIAIDGEAASVLRKQFELGQVARADVAAQETALAQAEAALPPLRKQLAVQRDLLAALGGHFPSERTEAGFDLDQLNLPAELPVSLPSQLVEHRPDIRMAEANLHAATAEVGVAIANMLPQLSLSGNDGTVATKLGGLFQPYNGFWTLGANLAQTLFDGGVLLGKERASWALLDQAGAQYRSTVITAFQNVADTLHALEEDANAVKANAAAEHAARESLDIVRRQMELGSVNYLAVITAEQSFQQANLNLVQSRATRYADTAVLFQALGGGWWNRENAVSTK